MGSKQNKGPAPTELTDKQVSLLAATTKYSQEEIRAWHKGFIRDCPGGVLDKKKFVESYKQFYPNGNVENYCKYAFATFDLNRDGVINFEEFLLSIAATRQGSLKARLEAAFDLFDISKDGLIDLNELATLISAMYDLVGETDRQGDREPTKRAADIMAKLDISGDNKISKAEFVAGCKEDRVIRQLLAPSVKFD